MRPAFVLLTALSSADGIARLPGDARGVAEPCMAEADDRILLLARTGSGFLYASWSDDDGETWSKPKPTTMVSACSSLTLKTLPDGRLIVFYNHAAPIKAGAFFPRTPLCYAVSGDGGQTWGPPVIVDDEGVTGKDRQNIYPSVCFTPEGMLVMRSTSPESIATCGTCSLRWATSAGSCSPAAAIPRRRCLSQTSSPSATRP